MSRFRIVIDFIKKHKISYILGICCMFLGSYIQTRFPGVLGNTIDILGTKGFDAAQVWKNIGWIMVIALATFVFTLLWRILVIGNARKLECDLRSRLFQHFLILSPNFYNHRKTGDLIAYAINDINAVRMTFGPALAMSINSAVISAASIFAMIVGVNSRLTVLTLIPFPFVIWAMIVIGKKVRKSFLRVQESFAAISGKVDEGIHGIRVIKAYVQEAPTLADFKNTSNTMVEAAVKMTAVSSVLGPLIEVCFSISFALNLIVGGKMVLDGVITLGAFVAFNTYLTMIIGPILSIGRIINILQRGIASMDRLNDIFLTKPEIQDRAHATDKPLNGAITISDLHFSYHGTEAPALEIQSLSVPDGSTLGILGSTGSGKSTLASLLLRAYDTENDCIFLGDQAISEYSLERLRNSIGHVSQEPFLFSATIRENITCFDGNQTEERIRKAAADSQILESIDAMPNGLDTLLGERGVNLSGGQRQRVAIAQALLRNPAILILDDAMSAVDTLTEAGILGNLLKNRADKTTIIISHRVSAVAAAENILVLDAGKVVQSGTHEALLLEGGLYREIYEDQEESKHSLLREE